MTIATSTGRIQYNGNGGTTAFATNFKLLDTGHVEVILTSSAGVDTVQTISTHYTVVLGASTATVTMVTPPASGEKLTLRLNVPLTQTYDLVNGQAFNADTIETALDLGTQSDQKLSEELDRSVKLAKSESTTFDGELPTGATALDLIQINAANDGFKFTTVNDLGIQAALDGDLTPTAGNIIRGNGTEWENSTVKAGLESDITPTNGDFMVGDGTYWTGESGDTARRSMGVNEYVRRFDTVALMKADADLTSGDIVETLGYTSVRDGGAARYRIRTAIEFSDTPDEKQDHTLNNAAVAEFIPVGAVSSYQITGTDTVTLYVTSAGSNTGRTGFASGSPLLTLQAAIDQIEGYNTRLIGNWKISIGAGTFAKGRFTADALRSELPLEIYGVAAGHPNVPTTIISNGANHSGHGIRADNYANLKVKDIKFTDYEGTSSSSGVTVDENCNLIVENCHFNDCYWGIGALRNSTLDVKGGIFTDCGNLLGVASNGAGIRSMFNSSHSIGTQNQGDLLAGPVFSNCSTGFRAQESATGHADWCTFEDCIYGITCVVNSRVNMDGSSFERNNVDARALLGSTIGTTSNNTYGTGADKSTVKTITGSGGNLDTDQVIDGVYFGANTRDETFQIERQYTTYTGTTSQQAVETHTLKAPLFDNTNTTGIVPKKLNFKIHGVISGTNSTKQVYMRFGSQNLTHNFGASDTGNFIMEGTIYLTSTGQQFGYVKAHISGAAPTISYASLSQTLTSDATYGPAILLGNASDSVTVYVLELGISG